MTATGSWYGLLGVYGQIAFERDYDRHRTPAACPNDGTPLQPAPAGGLHCRFDGYEWPRDGLTGAGWQ